MQELPASRFGEVIAPCPVVLISTLFGDVKNVAPYGMVMPVSLEPPLMAFGIREERDTYKNIMDTGEFVVAYPTPELTEAVDKTARSLPRNQSEFTLARLTPYPSRVVHPYSVMECPVNIECRLEWAKQAGDHHIVVGKVVSVSVSDRLFSANLSRTALNPIYHLSAPGHEYARLGPAI